MPEPIPILLMVRELGIGGIERDLAKLAKAIDRNKFSPHVGCFVGDGLRTAELRSAGVPIVTFPVSSFLSWSFVESARQMGRYVREHKIKLVHTFDVPTVLFGVPVARFYRMPAIVSAQLGERELFSSTHHRLLRWSDKLADVVVANSKFIQRSLIEREKIPADRTYLCYNGVETAVFRPQAEAKPAVVASAPLVIGTVCALRREKRLDLLLRAFAQVRPAAPGAKLLIVGSGPVLPELETLRDELKLELDCIFEPATSDVPPWLRALDIYVMCSESESFPNALLEAMASGCAVVGSNVGGIPELISDGDTGLLFESQNIDSLAGALLKLINDPGLRRQFSQRAATAARENFSMEANAGRNEALYEMLLARKRIAVPTAQTVVS